WIGDMRNVALVRGHARFVAPKQVEVDGRTLSAAKVFINVGGRAMVPDLPGLEDIAYFTNSTMMDVDFLPEHLVIVGGSYIGLEFAQMYRRFGSKVTVVERAPKLLPREDDDVAAEIRAILEREGVSIRTGAECLSFSRRDGGIAVGVGCGEGDSVVTGSHLLLALGRLPNTHDLGLDRAGVEEDSP